MDDTGTLVQSVTENGQAIYTVLLRPNRSVWEVVEEASGEILFRAFKYDPARLYAEGILEGWKRCYDAAKRAESPGDNPCPHYIPGLERGKCEHCGLAPQEHSHREE